MLVLTNHSYYKKEMESLCLKPLQKEYSVISYGKLYY